MPNYRGDVKSYHQTEETSAGDDLSWVKYYDLLVINYDNLIIIT